MDHNFYDNDFEDFLKQKADQHKMYPSDRVWDNIYSTLHGRRKWYGLGFIVLFIGAALFTGKEMVLNNYNRVATKLNDGTENADAGSTAAKNTTAKVVNINTRPVASAFNSISGNVNTTASEQQTVSKNTLANTDPAASYDFTKRALGEENQLTVIENQPPVSIAENDMAATDLIKPTVVSEKTIAKKEVASVKANSQVKEEITPAPVVQNDNAAVELKLAPLDASKWSYQLYASPIKSYRRLSTLDQYYTGIPVASNYAGNINQYVHHKPAIGFEVGSKIQYQLSPSLSLFVGAQINYSRYYIDAYRYHTEKASIALSNARTPDTLSGYTNIRNFEGYAPEQLQNEYLQLSIPIGIQIKLIGNKRLQLNVAGGIQPTFMLASNSYLLSSDYKNYIQSPDLARNFNVHTNFEAFISYKTGSVKWQLGPQFRSQLLSSYSNQYRVREYLTEVGIKLGITKSF